MNVVYKVRKCKNTAGVVGGYYICSFYPFTGVQKFAGAALHTIKSILLQWTHPMLNINTSKINSLVQFVSKVLIEILQLFYILTYIPAADMTWSFLFLSLVSWFCKVLHKSSSQPMHYYFWLYYQFHRKQTNKQLACSCHLSNNGIQRNSLSNIAFNLLPCLWHMSYTWFMADLGNSLE